MALNAKTAGGGGRPKQELLEADVYPGRLVQVIDLGIQAQRPYQGQEKDPVQEIMFTYELSEEFMKDEDGNDIKDKPRWISETMPLHNLKADRAKSTKRYNAFDPANLYDGDFSACVGAPVNITVVVNKEYNNVGDVASMSSKKADKLPELVNKPKVFDLDNPDMETFNSLPQWVQDKLKANLTFEGSALQKALKGAPKQKEEKKPVQQDDEEDSNPY